MDPHYVRRAANKIGYIMKDSMRIGILESKLERTIERVELIYSVAKLFRNAALCFLLIFMLFCTLHFMFSGVRSEEQRGGVSHGSSNEKWDMKENKFQQNSDTQLEWICVEEECYRFRGTDFK